MIEENEKLPFCVPFSVLRSPQSQDSAIELTPTRDARFGIQYRTVHDTPRRTTRRGVAWRHAAVRIHKREATRRFLRSIFISHRSISILQVASLVHRDLTQLARTDVESRVPLRLPAAGSGDGGRRGRLGSRSPRRLTSRSHILSRIVTCTARTWVRR